MSEAPRLRLVFFGTPEYAVPTLDRLLEGRHPVVAVVSQPDRPTGRGRTRRPSPVSARALARGLPLLRPDRVGEAEVVDALCGQAPDLGVVVAFGQFIPRAVRELPVRGHLINGHASLLPRHRGAAPIQHAILAGDTETGVSVMRVEREMDAGPVALTRRTPIGSDESAGALALRLATLTADVIAETLDLLAVDRVTWTAQDHDAATLAPKIASEDAHLDWSEPAATLVRRVRAMAPTPGAFAEYAGERLRILAADSDESPVDAPPGTASLTPDGTLRIATASGWLLPRTLQRPGKKPLDTASYLRGRRLPPGTSLS